MYAGFSIHWTPLTQEPSGEEVGQLVGGVREFALNLGGSVVSQVPHVETGSVVFVVEGLDDPAPLLTVIDEHFGPEIYPVRLSEAVPASWAGSELPDVIIADHSADIFEALYAAKPPPYLCSCGADLGKERHRPGCPWG